MKALLALVLLSSSIIPIRSPADEAYRYRVAWAATMATKDDHEQRLLMSVAAHESHFDPNVGTCKRRGDQGKAVTLWQMQIFGRKRRRACRNLVNGAVEALYMIRQSIHECQHLPEPLQLSFYASGSCRKGHHASKVRWVE